MGSGSGIDKLSDSSHYPDRAMQMEALLEEKELWDIVTGTKPVPTTGPNSKAMKAYVQQGKVTKAKIILHLDKSQLPHAHLHTAKEIWDNLTCIHRAHSFGTLLAMHQKFFYMVMDEEKSMEAWIASVWDIAHRLEAADFEVMDIDLIIALTWRLPDQYDLFIISLDTTPIDQLSVDSIITCLLNEEFCQLCFHDTAALSHSQLRKKTWSKNSKVKSIASEEQPPRSPHCYNCGGRGCLAHDCPSPKQEGENANKGDSGSIYATQGGGGGRSSQGLPNFFEEKFN
jgi:hypothetical protein